MAELSFILAGQDADAAADELAAALDGGDGITAQRTPVETASDPVARRGIDLIALAALILSIPPAALAVADIVDRIRKRRKAQSVIDTATRLRLDRRVEAYLFLADGTVRSVADLDADTLLDLAAESDPPKP